MTLPSPQGRLPNLLNADFVENAGVADLAIYQNCVPYRPTVLARCLTNQIELTIGSVPGYQLLLQQTANLTTNVANAIWTPVTNVTITSFPHVLALPLPQGPQAFWRAIVN